MGRLIWAVLITASIFALFSCGEKITRPHELPTGGTIGETTYVQLDPPWDDANGYDFNNPHKLIVGYDTYIYVCDTDNNRIVRLDPHGAVVATYDVFHPVGITQDELMRLLVVDGMSRKVYKINVGPGGSGQATICYFDTMITDPDDPDTTIHTDIMAESLLIDGTEVFTDIANAPGYIKRYYVATTSPDIARSGKIVVFHNSIDLGQDTDSLLHTKYLVQGDTAHNPIIVNGTGLGSTNHPTSILAFRRNSRDYLLITQDSSSFRTQLLAWNNNTYYKLGWYATAISPGADNDMYSSNFFSSPACGAIDSSGNMYVVDKYSGIENGALKFDPTGKLKETWGPPGAGDSTGQMMIPAGIAYDNFASRRTVYIADTGNNRILRFKLSTDLEQ